MVLNTKRLYKVTIYIFWDFASSKMIYLDQKSLSSSEQLEKIEKKATRKNVLALKRDKKKAISNILISVVKRKYFW